MRFHPILTMNMCILWPSDVDVDALRERYATVAGKIDLIFLWRGFFAQFYVLGCIPPVLCLHEYQVPSNIPNITLTLNAPGDPTPTVILGLSMLTWWLGYSGRIALLGFAIAGTLAIWQGPYVYGCISQVRLGEVYHHYICKSNTPVDTW